MERDRLHGLIKEKNERLEREALRTAEGIIEAIAKSQARIVDEQRNIAELRAQLKALSVAQLDAAELLGQE